MLSDCFVYVTRIFVMIESSGIVCVPSARLCRSERWLRALIRALGSALSQATPVPRGIAKLVIVPNHDNTQKE